MKCVWVCLVTQSCSTLCNPMNCNQLGSSVHGIVQARMVKWVAIMDWGYWDWRLKKIWMCTQSCLTLCHPMDRSPPGSFVHGIFQARLLEWVAISSSRGYSRSRDWTHVSCICRQILYHSLSHLGKPYIVTWGYNITWVYYITFRTFRWLL